MIFEKWFPTLVAHTQVNESVRVDTESKILHWVNQNHHTNYLELGTKEYLTTSYFKNHDVLNDLQLNSLRDSIVFFAKQFADEMNIKMSEGLIQIFSWINFFYPNQSEHQHNHYGNCLSGVYYVLAEPDSGNYRFFDPAAQKVMWTGLYINESESSSLTCTSGNHKPEPGKLILFPSWLEHSVEANNSSKVRISIAFNVNFK